MASKSKGNNSSRSSSAGSRKDKHGSNKNGKKGDGPSGTSFFTWFMIIALLGVWSSVAVVWFDLVDYEEVLGKLGIHDADGDGDFDLEDAKILLGLTKGDGSEEQIDTIEEVLDIITEESSNWVYGFLSFLYDVMTPFEILEEENEASEDVAEPGGKVKAKEKSKEKGLKKAEGPIPAEHFGKNEEPVYPPFETETEQEASEPIDATVAQESFATNIEQPEEEEEEPVEEEEPFEEEEEEEEEEPEPVEEEGPEPVEEEPEQEEEEEPEPEEEGPEPVQEQTNEFDAVAEDSEAPEAAEVEYDHEKTDAQDESAYVEDEAYSEREETLEDSGPEVEDVSEERFEESEVREEEDEDYTVSDEVVLEPEEVVSEQDIPDVYESEMGDFSDHQDSEGEMEEDMPMSDEYIEDKELELQDIMDEFYAGEPEQVPEIDDIQEALPVQEGDENDLLANGSQNLDVESEIQDAVPLPEAVEDLVEKEDDILEDTDEHPTEEGEPKEEAIAAEPDKRFDSEMKKEEKAKKKKPKLLNSFDKTIKTKLDAAEKLRKKGKSEEALQAFNELLRKYPQSPRAKFGKAQSEDDLAEKMRSNEILQRAIDSYGEVVDMSNPTADLVKMASRRQANRQQFLGHIKRSVMTLKKLVFLYPDDVTIKNELGVGYLLMGDNNNAKKVYEEVLAIAPNNGFAKVHYGFILKATNQIAESIPYLKEGLMSGDPGTDDGRFYFHLGDALQRVGDQDAYAWYELGHKRGHFASVWQRSLYNVNGLKAQPWWTAKEIGYTELVKALERNWKFIRDEGLAVMDKERGFFLPEDENLREKGDWGQFTIWQQGRKVDDSCKQVPKTCTLLDRFPESTGCKRGQIKYSIMQPGTHVWPHTGPTNCRLRMHLGLVIPKQGCRIRCANDTREWKEGKVIIFDDSFEHEVWQDADSYRLIFIVDVWHPELTAQQRRTLSPI